MNTGNEITINRKRPDWLKDDDEIIVRWANGGESNPGGWSPESLTAENYGSELGWGAVYSIKLPADHPYYKATEAGYAYHGGGSLPPEDWDNDTVLLRDGSTCPAHQIGYWKHGNSALNGGDIIGYKRRPVMGQSAPPPPPVPQQLPLYPVAPRWAFELVEKAYAAYRSVEPNPRNVDIMMSDQYSWTYLHAWADYIARTVEAPVDPVVLRARQICSDAENFTGVTQNPWLNGDYDGRDMIKAVQVALREGMGDDRS